MNDYIIKVLALLIFVGIIYFMTIFHEFCHFILARFYKFPVKEVGFGFGPTFYEFQHKETTFKFKAFFIFGGYTKRDDNDFTINSDKRFLIAIAGPLGNILLGIFLLFLSLGYHAFNVILFENGFGIQKCFLSVTHYLDIVYASKEHALIIANSHLLLFILAFSGVFSYLMGIVNLIPLPPLDGGRALFHLSEHFIKKDSREEYYLNYMKYGLYFMIAVNLFLVFYK